MDIKEINEAIYASSNGAIVERRKSTIVPIIVLLAGVAMLVANYLIENGNDTNNLKSSLVLAGGALSLLGAALCGMRIFGGGVPYHKADRCFLVSRQYSFDLSQRREVENIVKDANRVALENIEESDVTSILVLCYCSPKGSFVAMQAFVYDEFDYKPITELKIKA